ncbi:hypothetical protein CRG49_012605 [Neisseria sp. N95_16]|nr:hypothetical protein CRG49_012605 [Neisseria sp. N95_16]
MAKHINQKNSETINAKQLATLESECPKKGTGVAGLDILHGTLHNYSHQITAQQVIVLHDNFEPLIKAIWDSILKI